jgi:hypothetical protein
MLPDGNSKKQSYLTFETMIWEVPSGRLLGRYLSGWHTEFSPDGRWFLDGQKVRDVATGTTLHEIPMQRSTNWAAALRPDNRHFAQPDNNGGVNVWDTKSWQVVRRFARPGVNALAYSPDGQRLAAGLGDGTVRIIDPETGSEMQLVRTADHSTNWLAFHANGRQLITSSSGIGLNPPQAKDTIHVWDLDPPQHARTITGIRDGRDVIRDGRDVSTMCYHPDGRRVVAVGHDGRVRLWDAATGKIDRTLAGPESEVCHVAVSPDGRLAAALARDVAQVWDIESGQVRHKLPLPSGGLYGQVAFSPNSRYLAVALASGLVVFEVASEQTVFFVQDKRSTAGLPSGILRLRPPITPGFLDVAFSPDGARLVALMGQERGGATIQLLDAATGRELAAKQAPGYQHYSVRWFRDGMRFATVNGAGQVVIHAADGRNERTFSGHEAAAYGVAISPDEKRLATASRDGTVRVWDVATGDELILLAGSGSSFCSVAFSPDGFRLAATSADGTLRIWDASPVPEAPPVAPVQTRPAGPTS